jgi:hypothetical protein
LERGNENLVLQTFPPSHRAACAITAARLSSQIVPGWSPLLQAVSGLKYADISPCLAEMLEDRQLPLGGGSSGLSTPTSPNEYTTPGQLRPSLDRCVSADSGIHSPLPSPAGFAPSDGFETQPCTSSPLHRGFTVRQPLGLASTWIPETRTPSGMLEQQLATLVLDPPPPFGHTPPARQASTRTYTSTFAATKAVPQRHGSRSARSPMDGVFKIQPQEPSPGAVPFGWHIGTSC